MKILCVCDQGNNRSVVLAHQLKYWGNDVLSAGLDTNSLVTLMMLYDWADIIILTEEVQRNRVMEGFKNKVRICDIGPDIYPRPFNPELLTKVKDWLQENKDGLKNI